MKIRFIKTHRNLKPFFLLLFFLPILTNSLFAQNKKISTYELDIVKEQLERLFMEDQLFRRLYLDAEEKFGKDSEEMDYFWQVVEDQDKRIEKEFIEIIETYGWLGISDVGRRANTAQFSIIQHSSKQTKEKYAPLMKKSVLINESQSMQYARLIDRMLINDNKPQLYGSQITTNESGNPIFFEIKNPDDLNKRRKDIGLGPIEDFAKERGIEW